MAEVLEIPVADRRVPALHLYLVVLAEPGRAVEHWNDNPEPFVWHRPANEIIAKVQRGRAAL